MIKLFRRIFLKARVITAQDALIENLKTQIALHEQKESILTSIIIDLNLGIAEMTERLNGPKNPQNP